MASDLNMERTASDLDTFRQILAAMDGSTSCHG